MGFRNFLIVLLIVTLGTIQLPGLNRGVFTQEQEVVGTFFGDPVSKENYYFVLRIVLLFSSPWGGIPNNGDQLNKRVWDDLLLSYEAYRRQISVGTDEVEEKIDETLKNQKVSFDRTQDREAYVRWVQETLGESVTIFENQMRHLVQIKKLHTQILNSINPTVTEQQAFQEYLNEYNSLSVELVELDDLNEAQSFYEKAKTDPGFWEMEAKKDRELAREDQSFKRPGFVALEFLMDLWQIPKKAVFDMIELEKGSFYPPQPIHNGYGVFKVLDIRRADEAEFPKRKDSYFEQLRARGKYDGFRNWLENLAVDADRQIYIDPPDNIFP